jgi:hypothetical protein
MFSREPEYDTAVAAVPLTVVLAAVTLLREVLLVVPEGKSIKIISTAVVRLTLVVKLMVQLEPIPGVVLPIRTVMPETLLASTVGPATGARAGTITGTRVSPAINARAIIT